jgi:hypothetical protein
MITTYSILQAEYARFFSHVSSSVSDLMLVYMVFHIGGLIGDYMVLVN